MGKKIVLLLAAIGFVFQISACTSSDNKGDASNSVDVEGVDGANTEVKADSNMTSDTITEDQLAADPAAQTTENTSNQEVTSTTTTTETRDEKTATTDNAAVENTTSSTDTQTAPAQNNAVTEVAPPIAPEASQAVVVPPTEQPAEPVAKASLQKMQATPWQVGDTWVNAVYFARPGQTLAKISKKIYGANKVAALKKINPTLASGVRPGDKVYYNSPVRPDDSLRLLTYYEDNGVAAEMYTAQEGDNLRKISKKLLGYDNAWKEVWSTNLVESKTTLTAGTELRYWKGDVTPVSMPMAGDGLSKGKKKDLAENAPPMPDEMAAAGAAGQVPPPSGPNGPNGPNAGTQPMPPPDMAPPMPPPAIDPPPPVPPVAGNELAPPPPPPMEATPEGNPVEKKDKKKKAAKAEDDFMSQDNMIAMAAVGAALVGLIALLIVRKKRKQKEAEAAFGDTHVG